MLKNILSFFVLSALLTGCSSSAGSVLGNPSEIPEDGDETFEDDEGNVEEGGEEEVEMVTFGENDYEFECDDPECTEHIAGWLCAEANGVVFEDECDEVCGDSFATAEGCIVYVNTPYEEMPEENEEFPDETGSDAEFEEEEEAEDIPSEEE